MNSWQANLDLVFSCARGQTFLSSVKHEGPLYVQRPFTDASGTCQVYVLHPPSGIVGGDELAVRVVAEAGTRVLLTSPGATKFYRSAGQFGRLFQHVSVHAGASCEWFPQETIVFDGALGEAKTVVQVGAGGSFLGWEIVALGRPAAGERFERGRFLQSFELWCDDEAVWLDLGHYCGGEALLDAAHGLGGRPVSGVFVSYPAAAAALDAAQSVVQDEASRGASQGWLAVTLVEGALVCRYLGYSTHRARGAFARVWQRLRPLVLGKDAHPPRIWAT